MPSKLTEKYLGKTCDTCGFGHYIDYPEGNEWNIVCNECGANLFCYKPLPHQVAFHEDNAKYRMFAGKNKSAGVKSDKIGENLTA